MRLTDPCQYNANTTQYRDISKAYCKLAAMKCSAFTSVDRCLMCYLFYSYVIATEISQNVEHIAVTTSNSPGYSSPTVTLSITHFLKILLTDYV